MRQFWRKISSHPIILSLVAHLLALALFLLIRLHNEPAPPVEIFIQLSEPVAEIMTPVPDKEPVTHAPTPTVFNEPEFTEPITEEIVHIDSTTNDSVKKFDRTSFFVNSPSIMFKQPLDSLETDSLDTLLVKHLAPAMPNLLDSTYWKVEPGLFSDRVERDIYQKNMGHAPAVPLGQALGEGAKYLSDLFNKHDDDRPVRMTFIPTKVELEILKAIWDQTSVTDIEIYAAMDTSIRITAVDMNHALEHLENKGLVKRELVSPQHLFTFPLGQVEMSRKNRRNRVYLYKANIAADEVIRYLQAILYEAEHGAVQAEDSSQASHIESLKKKVMQLLQSKG